MISSALISFTPWQGALERLVLVMGQVAFRQVVGHARFHPHRAFFALQVAQNQLADCGDLVLPAHGGKAQHVVGIQPGFIRHARGVDHKGEGGRQPLGWDDDIGAPGEEGVGRPGERAQARAEVDIHPVLCHLALDGFDPCRKIDEIRIARHGCS